jgi:RHS repeat-associated protein
MAVTNYYSIDSEILGEKTTGGSRVDYLTDALGSVTATLNQSAQVQNTYRYKPSGSQLAKTGVAADPSFLWVGSQGYRQTGRKFSDFYVRARHYSSEEGRWTTKDPIGLDDGDVVLYVYVGGRPTLLLDPEGLRGCKTPEPCCTAEAIEKHFAKLPCPLGSWGNFNPSRDESSCNVTRRLMIYDPVKARGICAVIAERLLWIKKSCDGIIPQDQPGFSLYAATFCCSDPSDDPNKPNPSHLCAIKICSKSDLPEDNATGACLRSCLYSHEQSHGVLCIRDPINSNEPCAYSVEAICLINKMKAICRKHGYWKPELDEVERVCRNMNADCGLPDRGGLPTPPIIRAF